MSPRPGPTNSLADVAGIRVGHHSLRGDGWLTGTTVVLAPDGGMVAGVDVRGGGPGTRETDLLDPSASVERIHAVVLTGGSAYGLASASGAAAELGDRGIGFPVGIAPGEVVPIVPAAVLFDLGRGGSFRATPGEEAGRAAVVAAMKDAAEGVQGAVGGSVGAGTGALTAGLKGGVGSASVVLPGGATVAALVVANAIGSPVDQRTGELLGTRLLLPGDADGLRAPAESELDRLLLAAAARRMPPDLPTAMPADPSASTIQNTTLVVVATDVALTKAQCRKLAGLAHDGLARSLDPVHTMFDGDTVFGVSTSSRPAADVRELHEVLCAAADVTTRAVVRALLAATRVTTPNGDWPGYLDLAPSAVRREEEA